MPAFFLVSLVLVRIYHTGADEVIACTNRTLARLDKDCFPGLARPTWALILSPSVRLKPRYCDSIHDKLGPLLRERVSAMQRVHIF